jgi:hypothetical protein
MQHKRVIYTSYSGLENKILRVLGMKKRVLMQHKRVIYTSYSGLEDKILHVLGMKKRVLTRE